MEKLTKGEERIAGAVGHMIECLDCYHNSDGMAERVAAEKNYDRAVAILRAAVAMHELDRVTVRAQKAVEEQNKKGRLLDDGKSHRSDVVDS